MAPGPNRLLVSSSSPLRLGASCCSEFGKLVSRLQPSGWLRRSSAFGFLKQVAPSLLRRRKN